MRYTPLFCEENIWWLARSLVADGVDVQRLKVLILSNPWHSIMLLKQRQAEPQGAVWWDYHVVLLARMADGSWIFDPDSRLPLPVSCDRYLAETFPPQPALPEQHRTLVRQVPAAGYLAHFHSDRSHMLGRIPSEAFPAYPIIQPAAGQRRIDLADYRDMGLELDDGSVIMPVEDLRCDTPGKRQEKATERRTATQQ